MKKLWPKKDGAMVDLSADGDRWAERRVMVARGDIGPFDPKAGLLKRARQPGRSRIIEWVDRDLGVRRLYVPDPDGRFVAEHCPAVGVGRWTARRATARV